MTSNELKKWLKSNPEIGSIRTVLCDLNGVLRGKRLPRELAKKAMSGELKLPLSTMGVDIWGRDAVDSGQVLETGDSDGICTPTERGFNIIDWLDQPTALLPVWMHQEDGSPYASDPRQALAAILKRFEALGLTPVCASELEFYLYDPKTVLPCPPMIPGSDRRMSANSVYGIDDLDSLDGFLNDVYAACKSMNVPADAGVSENGCGQFEINLNHLPDALKAADDAVYFKYIVKGIAKKHGMGATFMAKPYGRESGSGMHIHFSLIDKSAKNLFDNGTPEGSDLLRSAVAGLLETMTEFMLFFAPHHNSYRRLRAGTHAPVNIGWGYDNRTTSIRIPSSSNAARRIEHRVAGADANPYLVMAAILGGALIGLENKLEPVDPVVGNSYAQDMQQLPRTWTDAIGAMQNSGHFDDVFDPMLRELYLAAKRQELDGFAEVVSAFEYETYLDTV